MQLSGTAMLMIAVVTSSSCASVGVDELEPSTRAEESGLARQDALAEGDANGALGELITSSATGDDGSRYVAGVFSGTLVIGGVLLTSHGGSDIFVARLRPNGGVIWAEAIGSPRDETDPKVTFSDGRVKVVGMTSGAVDCGRGPLNTWTTETFFVCTFERDGSPINGATFPTGRQ